MKVIRIQHDAKGFELECTNSVVEDGALIGHHPAGDVVVLCGDKDEHLVIGIDDDGKLSLEGEEWAVSERSGPDGSFVYLNCPDSARIGSMPSEPTLDEVLADIGPDDGEEPLEPAAEEKPEEKPEEVKPEEKSEEDELNELIGKALDAIDAENDDHWTQGGKPAMAFIEDFCGTEEVTRKQVEAVSKITREELIG